ncbi:MAG: cyclic nucleotide-binding domain-containing protein [Treponema sp.]|nr:cyclic nucleotide-binding domain-containing protein [Treponema sp.]
MKKILVASTNKEVCETVYTACEKYAEYFDSVFCPDTDDALSYIDYELPEIKVLDYSSTDIDCHRILAGINQDPWLHNGGIIAVVPNPAMASKIEEQKDPNIIIVQTLYTFKENFQRLLRILQGNQHFLVNRGMQDRVGGQENGSFVCGNDPMDIRLYTSFLVNYLYCTNRISDDGRYALQTTLMELLTNALEHGNCDISYDEKTTWLENGGNILDLINKKRQEPEVAARKIHLTYLIGKEKSTFAIQDDGKGFDWRSRMEKAQDPLALFSEETHGRGMALSNSLVSGLTYNDKGNKVSFEINNLLNASNNVPGIMVPFATIEYTKHQIVCKQNEPSNDLYFIVSGRYGVYANGKLISVLTPADMFIGEMAFLLNDRRSATILSAGEGKLIKIPKTSFLNLIRKNPHYGIFLSKLLAQRVVRQNIKTLELSAQIEDLKKELEN